jgi:hypothetical protein
LACGTSFQLWPATPLVGVHVHCMVVGPLGVLQQVDGWQ